MGDDPRIGRIETDLKSEIKESAEFRGEMRQFAKNMNVYIDAVSTKAGAAKIALDAHKDDPAAHPALTLSQRDKLDVKIIGWVTAIGGCSGLIGAFFHHFFTSSAKHGP